MAANDSTRLEALLASAALRLFALAVIAWGLSGVFLTDLWLQGCGIATVISLCAAASNQ